MKDALDHTTLEERYEAELGAHLLTSVEFQQLCSTSCGSPAFLAVTYILLLLLLLLIGSRFHLFTLMNVFFRKVVQCKATLRRYQKCN